MHKVLLILLALAPASFALVHCGEAALESTCAIDDPSACPAGYVCEATRDGTGTTRCLRLCDDDRECTRNADFAYGCSLDVIDGGAAGICRPPAVCDDDGECPEIAACGAASCDPYECRLYTGGTVKKCFPAGLCPYLGDACATDGDCCVGLVCAEGQCARVPAIAEDAGDGG